MVRQPVAPQTKWQYESWNLHTRRRLNVNTTSYDVAWTLKRRRVSTELGLVFSWKWSITTSFTSFCLTWPYKWNINSPNTSSGSVFKRKSPRFVNTLTNFSFFRISWIFHFSKKCCSTVISGKRIYSRQHLDNLLLLLSSVLYQCIRDCGNQLQNCIISDCFLASSYYTKV